MLRDISIFYIDSTVYWTKLFLKEDSCGGKKTCWQRYQIKLPNIRPMNNLLSLNLTFFHTVLSQWDNKNVFDYEK